VAAVKGPPAGVELRVDMPEHFLPPMRSDRKKITKILIGLLSNAYKFTPKGEVRLAVAVERGRVTYAVQDTGIGIPAGAVHAVFDEFRQGDGSMTRRYGGTGLGLALSRRLAQLLGGDIEVASAPVQGTTFTVELPLETVPSSPMASPIAPTDGDDSL
jgi:signal transduction histidine kinase